MSYQVLARKWRPRRFSELVGQEHVVTAISNALDNNRLHHAYLFTGTRGVGKTTIARIFSKSLNCETGMSANPCGECATCKEIEQGNYVDLLEIDAASRTKVEDTRELLDNVQYRPTRGDYKVYLIDEVHMLSKHSFNALLKTLEEPPPHVKFLLATTDPQKLPVTILSRCLQFNLKALSRDQINKQLSFVLEQEKIAFETPALVQLARAAQGSMRDALSLTDQAIAQGNGNVSLQIVTDMLGLMDKGQVLKLVNSVLANQSEEVFQQVESLSAQAPDYSQLLNEIMSLLHQIALTQLVPDVCKLETISAKAVYQLAKSVAPEQIQLFYQIALQGKKDISYSADPRMGLEMTLLRMLAFNPSPINFSIEDINKLAVSSQSHRGINQSDIEHKSEPDTQSELKNDTGRENDEDGEKLNLAQLESQQSAILKQAETLVDIQAPDNSNHFTDSNDDSDHTAIQDFYDEASFSGNQHSQTAAQHANEADYSNPENTEIKDLDANGLPSKTKPSATETLIALKKRLDDTVPEEPASDVKKSNKVNDRNETTNFARADDQQNVIESKTSSDSADQSNSPESDESELFSAPFEQEIASPLDLDEQHSNEPPWNIGSLHGEKAQQADFPIVEDNYCFDPTSHLEESLNVEIDLDIPLFLENGDKVTQASQIDTWSQIIEQMQIAALTKQLALHSSYEKNNHRVTLKLLDSKPHLNTEQNRQQLQQALSDTFKENVQLEVVHGQPKNTPFGLQQAINIARHQYARKLVNSDQNIVRVRDMFSASIVEESIKAR